MNINATLFVQMAVFFVGAWITMKFIWPPLNRAIEERQKKIADGLAAADRGEHALEANDILFREMSAAAKTNPVKKNQPIISENSLNDKSDNKNNEKLPVYSINNKLGFVPQSEQFEGVDSEDRGYDIKLYKIINKNTFAYNPARINVGSIGYSENLENIIISSLYVCFKTDNTVNDNFLYQYLKTDFFNREVLRNVEGGVRDYLFYDNFARIKFGLPCIEEQKKIADYLSSIDSKIDIESQLLQKLEEQKRFLLQQMFV